eukprot:3901175-Rhodomonas_salina.2
MAVGAQSLVRQGRQQGFPLVIQDNVGLRFRVPPERLPRRSRRWRLSAQADNGFDSGAVVRAVGGVARLGGRMARLPRRLRGLPLEVAHRIQSVVWHDVGELSARLLGGRGARKTKNQTLRKLDLLVLVLLEETHGAREATKGHCRLKGKLC